MNKKISQSKKFLSALKAVQTAEAENLRGELLNTHRDYLRLMKDMQRFIYGYWLAKFLYERNRCSNLQVPPELSPNGNSYPTLQRPSRAATISKLARIRRNSRKLAAVRLRKNPTQKAVPDSEKSRSLCRKNVANRKRGASKHFISTKGVLK